jgi:single-stranded-DNA-specific exonuclease
MTDQRKTWEILSRQKAKGVEDVVRELLNNRGIKTENQKKEFLNPVDPAKISIESLGVRKSPVEKAIERIKRAKKNKEGVIIYGDYDADGITATAIMWEVLHKYGLNVLPHIPDRFEEGYGINAESVKKLKSKIPELKLIVTVDNGIIGYEGIKVAGESGIDTIVIDHHQKGDKAPGAYSIIHSDKVCGSALAWFFAKELGIKDGLELAAIGTIADQMPLVGVNRSVVKYGLAELNNTERPGLLALITEARLENIGTHEVNYIIAPRINAMGRLAQGIDSLRLLCTKRSDKALELSKLLSKTNFDRQRIVEEVLLHVRGGVATEKIIVLAHESYHEGVIGLAAGKLVEEFYRPAIVLSTKGEVSKASARSISGFNIIEAIKSTGLILEGGGHPMAAGFSIKTKLIGKFTKAVNKFAKKLLTPDLLERKLKIDINLSFDQLNDELVERIKDFYPTGLGNPTPTFASYGVEVLDARAVGKEAKHIKLKLSQTEHVLDSIFFGGGEIYSKLPNGTKIDIAYQLEENTWNGVKSLQLKIKDVKTN